MDGPFTESESGGERGGFGGDFWRLNGPFAEKKIHEAGKEGRAEENAWAVQRDPPRSLSGL